MKFRRVDYRFKKNLYLILTALNKDLIRIIYAFLSD